MTIKKPMRLALVLFAASGLVGAASLPPGPPIGFFGLVEKVVFEPSEAGAERVQVWGAFAYADGGPRVATRTSAARRGYLYFRQDPTAGPLQREQIRTEWLDLKAAAGTDQAVGFGNWSHVGNFSGLDPSVKTTDKLPYILEMYPGRGEITDMRVRPASETPSAPAVYQTDASVMKIPDQGNRAAVVKALRDVLATK